MIDLRYLLLYCIKLCNQIYAVVSDGFLNPFAPMSVTPHLDAMALHFEKFNLQENQPAIF